MCPVEKEKPDWKKIAPRAVQERDPDKLLAIIEELNAVLEAGANERRARLYPPGTELESASYSWTTSPTSALPYGLTSVLIYVASLAVLSSQPTASLPTYELSALETASIDA